MGNARVGDRLRFEFVELLFALATAEIAFQFGVLAANHLTVLTAPTAYSHQMLALILVATSWIGWSISKAAGNRLPLENVFSLAFVVLMLDVALVVFYFVLARGVDPMTSTSLSVIPNAGHETFWVMMVFAVYVIWDFVTKAIARDPAEKQPTGFLNRLRGPFWKRGRISLLCAAIAFGAWYCLMGVTTATAVVMTDFGLLALDLFFRALKQGHKWWSITTAVAGTFLFAAAFFFS